MLIKKAPSNPDWVSTPGERFSSTRRHRLVKAMENVLAKHDGPRKPPAWAPQGLWMFISCCSQHNPHTSGNGELCSSKDCTMGHSLSTFTSPTAPFCTIAASSGLKSKYKAIFLGVGLYVVIRLCTVAWWPGFKSRFILSNEEHWLLLNLFISNFLTGDTGTLAALVFCGC